MFHFIKTIFTNDLYIQLWSNRLKVLNINTKEKYDIEPLMALKNNKKGQPIVIAIGSSVKALSITEYDQVINPFDHPRLLIHDFMAAERILKYAFREIHVNRFIAPSPRVIFHPMEKLEGGVTGIEQRAYREICLGAGAREIELYFGAELPSYKMDFDKLKCKNR